MAQQDSQTALDLSIKFKHGIHTIVIFVDPLAPISAAVEELFEVLQERYPGGLTTVAIPKRTTSIPTRASDIILATPKSASDLSEGWKALEVEAGDTPVDKRLKDGSVLAFAFQDEPEFVVDIPGYDDEEYAEQEPEMEAEE